MRTTTVISRTAATLAAAGVLAATASCAGARRNPRRPAQRRPAQRQPAQRRPPHRVDRRTASTAAPRTGAAPTTAPADPARTGNPAPRQGLPRCTTGELTVSLGEGGAAAGSVYRPLVFTNTGARTCELRGFPGISYVAGDDGHQVGPAAAMSGERGGRVPLPPGGTAQAQLQLVAVQNYDPADLRPRCGARPARLPPGDTASLFVPLDGTGCSATPPGNQLSVQTITP